MTAVSINPSDFFMTPVEKDRASLSFCDTNLAALQYWLAQLPSIQLGDSSKNLLHAIIEISELECEDSVRFDFIQSLHLSVEQALSLLEKHFLDGLYSVTNYNEHSVDLAQQFRCYLARIYLNIALNVDQQLNENKFSLFAFRQKKNLHNIRTLSTYYALEQISLLKYQQMVLYKNALIGQWRIGHRLFNLAEQNDFYQEDINHLQGAAHPLKNIDQVYSQITLMDILNTHQIRPIEIHALYQCTFQWVKLTRISRHQTNLTRYVIQTDNDFPPVFNNIKPKKDENIFFVETQSLLEHINLANLPNNKHISSTERHYLSPSLIFHVQNLLNNMPERRYERYDFTSNIQLVFGLQTAHFYLSHATPFNQTLQLDSAIDVQQSTSKFLSTWNSEVITTQHNYQTLDQEAKQIYSCTIMDISINGYRIRWSNMPPKQLRAGEFILVQESEKSPWRGGVIRWLKQSSDRYFEFGIEILSQEMTPCSVQLSAERNSLLYHPALILKNEVLNTAHLSIIVPGSQTFKSQQGISLRFGKKQIKIYLTECKLVSQSFTQLDFELLNGDEQILLDQFIQEHAETMKKQDLWESLK